LAGVVVVWSVGLRVLVSVALGTVVVSGLMVLLSMWRARTLDREMGEQSRDPGGSFTVSFTGIQIYGVFVWGLFMLVCGGLIFIWGVFFPDWSPDGSHDNHMLVPVGAVILLCALWIFVWLWVRLGTRLTVDGDRLVLVRWHRVHELRLSALVSAELVYGRGGGAGAEGLRLGFVYPGDERVRHLTLWQVATRYGRLRVWLGEHGYLADEHGTDSMTDRV
jgi:protein-S-isoprenylcysteine O-methyltransferase Ste14